MIHIQSKLMAEADVGFLKQHAANEPKYFCLFQSFGSPLKVINHLKHRNKTDSLGENQRV